MSCARHRSGSCGIRRHATGRRRRSDDGRETEMRYRPLTLAALVAVGAVTLPCTPAAHADNKRLNDGVVANVYTVQHQAGCTNDVKINPQLRLAAQWHTD